MNRFKFALAFKASSNLFLKQQQQNGKFIIANLSKQLKSTVAPLHQTASKKQTQFIYLNHKKYLSVSLARCQEQPSAAQQNESSPPPPPPQKKNKFMQLFDKEHGWKTTGTIFAVFALSIGGYFLYEWGQPKYDENGILTRDEFSDLPWYSAYPKRAWHYAWVYYEMWKDPNSDKLLPEPLQDPYYQPPYTLVIEMNGILVHPEWNITTGWRYKKRPGLDYFIDQVKYPMFEVVLFTNESYMAAAPVVSALDPENKIQFKLFRESTKYKDNAHIKDILYMNRDVKKIIIIDWNPEAYKLQPRNALHRLKKYQGEEDDTDLVYLAAFLKTIATSGVDDVRDVLDYYNSEVDPLETFKLNAVKLKEAEAKRLKEQEEWKKKQSSNPFSWARKNT